MMTITDTTTSIIADPVTITGCAYYYDCFPITIIPTVLTTFTPFFIIIFGIIIISRLNQTPELQT